MIEYDSSVNSLDLFGQNATVYNQEEYNTVAEAALSEATDALTELVRRVRQRSRWCRCDWVFCVAHQLHIAGQLLCTPCVVALAGAA